MQILLHIYESPCHYHCITHSWISLMTSKRQNSWSKAPSTLISPLNCSAYHCSVPTTNSVPVGMCISVHAMKSGANSPCRTNTFLKVPSPPPNDQPPVLVNAARYLKRVLWRSRGKHSFELLSKLLKRVSWSIIQGFLLLQILQEFTNDFIQSK